MLAVAFESVVAVMVLCGEGSDDEDEDVDERAEIVIVPATICL